MLFYSVTHFHSLSYFIYLFSNCCWLACWMSCWKSPCGRYCRNCPNHKRTCKWRYRSLHLSLVTRCCRRPRCRPPRLDGTLFLSPFTTKFKRWKRGRIHAHIFFRSARLLKFDRGAILPRQPYVDLSRPTLDRFGDGSQDFLNLSWLFSTNHSFDHSRYAQECINRINAIRGT